MTTNASNQPAPTATSKSGVEHGTPNAASIGFRDFYSNHFLPEHQHPINVALHVFGTVAGLVFACAALVSSMPYLVLLFPVVHAVPGLVGHRLFERNAAVGDVRVLRKDFSPLWFIVADHVMTFDLLRAGLRRLFRGTW
jgi:hypothetical protein